MDIFIENMDSGKKIIYFHGTNFIKYSLNNYEIHIVSRFEISYFHFSKK
ncbi:hypothetical protein MARI151_50021 [Maribacter litoralis]|uniref:Uncharacterized protein n=1 Tax=Maribacter litoralis TaxID=2059726 RepID=A0A653UNF2_9FLAO|nr:hypothetical protein MARI151_50021 [Maribacter litoralis]